MSPSAHQPGTPAVAAASTFLFEYGIKGAGLHRFRASIPVHFSTVVDNVRQSLGPARRDMPLRGLWLTPFAPPTGSCLRAPARIGAQRLDPELHAGQGCGFAYGAREGEQCPVPAPAVGLTPTLWKGPDMSTTYGPRVMEGGGIGRAIGPSAVEIANPVPDEPTTALADPRGERRVLGPVSARRRRDIRGLGGAAHAVAPHSRHRRREGSWGLSSPWRPSRSRSACAVSRAARPLDQPARQLEVVSDRTAAPARPGSGADLERIALAFPSARSRERSQGGGRRPLRGTGGTLRSVGADALR